MKQILNITNGDSAVKIMQVAGLPGEFLPWQDVLHDGPVPASLLLEELTEVRARFITEQGWGDPDKIKQWFLERDCTLKSFRDYSKVILWFEHDLYDQLQILQILDWFSEQAMGSVELTIICTEQYLGMLTPEQMKRLKKFEEPIVQAHLELAQKAWQAFCAPAPESWQALLHEDTSPLPFLQGAIFRLLEEYPDCKNGLSRTAQQALRIIAEGESKPGRVFGSYIKTEERRFMGDSSFWAILQEMLDSDPPLVTVPTGKKLNIPVSPEQVLSITAAGIEALDGNRNWLETAEIDRWIGGVHLAPENLWCWDAEACEIRKQQIYTN